MLTRAGSLRCVRRNLVEADDNPHSELRYANTDDSATLSSSEADRRCEACGGRVWFARRSDAGSVHMTAHPSDCHSRTPSTPLDGARYWQALAHHQPPPSSPPGPPAPVTGHCAPRSATPPASPSWVIASKGSNEGGCQPRPCAGAT